MIGVIILSVLIGGLIMAFTGNLPAKDDKLTANIHILIFVFIGILLTLCGGAL